jgi:DNA-binding NtrC family response regulator
MVLAQVLRAYEAENLIVDDEARMQRLFEINLGPKYEVMTAGDGEQALEVVKSRMWPFWSPT